MLCQWSWEIESCSFFLHTNYLSEENQLITLSEISTISIFRIFFLCSAGYKLISTHLTAISFLQTDNNEQMVVSCRRRCTRILNSNPSQLTRITSVLGFHYQRDLVLTQAEFFTKPKTQRFRWTRGLRLVRLCEMFWLFWSFIGWCSAGIWQQVINESAQDGRFHFTQCMIGMFYLSNP